jgi:hypothetical protein
VFGAFTIKLVSKLSLLLRWRQAREEVEGLKVKVAEEGSTSQFPEPSTTGFGTGSEEVQWS